MGGGEGGGGKPHEEVPIKKTQNQGAFGFKRNKRDLGGEKLSETSSQAVSAG